MRQCTNISEEPTASMETACFSHTSQPSYQTTRCYNSCKVNVKLSLGRSWNSSIGIETGYGPDSWGSNTGWGKIFTLSIASRLVLGPTQPPIRWVPEDLSPRVRNEWLISRSGHVAPGEMSWKDRKCCLPCERVSESSKTDERWAYHEKDTP
jgi:hypothetical protein